MKSVFTMHKTKSLATLKCFIRVCYGQCQMMPVMYQSTSPSVITIVLVNNSNIYFAEIGDAPLQNFDKASMCLVQLVFVAESNRAK